MFCLYSAFPKFCWHNYYSTFSYNKCLYFLFNHIGIEVLRQYLFPVHFVLKKLALSLMFQIVFSNKKKQTSVCALCILIVLG